jgi:hypothetical protein
MTELLALPPGHDVLYLVPVGEPVQAGGS